MRSTLYIAPASSDMLKNSQVPFAVAISPFARLHPNEVLLSVIPLNSHCLRNHLKIAENHLKISKSCTAV